MCDIHRRRQRLSSLTGSQELTCIGTFTSTLQEVINQITASQWPCQAAQWSALPTISFCNTQDNLVSSINQPCCASKIVLWKLSPDLMTCNLSPSWIVPNPFLPCKEEIVVYKVRLASFSKPVAALRALYWHRKYLKLPQIFHHTSGGILTQFRENINHEPPSLK